MEEENKVIKKKSPSQITNSDILNFLEDRLPEKNKLETSVPTDKHQVVSNLTNMSEYLLSLNDNVAKIAASKLAVAINLLKQ